MCDFQVSSDNSIGCRLDADHVDAVGSVHIPGCRVARCRCNRKGRQCYDLVGVVEEIKRRGARPVDGIDYSDGFVSAGRSEDCNFAQIVEKDGACLKRERHFIG